MAWSVFSSALKKYGARGLQVAALGYLAYRYYRSFVDEQWEERLSGMQSQDAISIMGFAPPYFVVTLGTPLIVLALEIWAASSVPKATVRTFWDEDWGILSWLVLILANAYMVTSCMSAQRLHASMSPSAGFRCTPELVGLYAVVSIAVAIVVARYKGRK